MAEAAEKPLDKRRALGRGLDSLLPSGPRVVAGTAVAPAPIPVDGGNGQAAVAPSQLKTENAVLRIPLDQIDENPDQTRRFFDPAALHEVAESIKANGVVQPIVVRQAAEGRYTLILGERRCRAAKLAGLETVPAIVRTASNQQAAEMTVIENLQRQDLNCMEQANAFARLSRDFSLTQEQIGERTGCSRESVANYMRLLKLPDEVQKYLTEGLLGFSEAKVLLQLNDPRRIPGVAKQCIEAEFSVAMLRNVVNMVNFPSQDPPKPRTVVLDPNVREAQLGLERALGCRVRISDRKGKGHITIQYTSLEDFDRIVEILERE